MAPVVKTRWLLRAVARLTGDNGTNVNEGVRFRVVVDTADGHRHSVHVQVDDHPNETRPYQLNQIADALCIGRKDLVDILENRDAKWLREHLQEFTKEQLTPPRNRR